MTSKIKLTVSNADKARATATRPGTRKQEDPIDFSAPYFVAAAIEKNPEAFLTPRGKAMVDDNDRKRTNSHQISLRTPKLSEDNKMVMEEKIETFTFPGWTSDFAEENGYPIEDVNRALYMSKACYPHREAFFRLYSADDLEPIELSEESEEIARARARNAEIIDQSATAMAAAKGKFVDRPGAETPLRPHKNGKHARPQVRRPQPGLNAREPMPRATAENQSDLDRLIESGAIHIEPEAF